MQCMQTRGIVPLDPNFRGAIAPVALVDPPNLAVIATYDSVAALVSWLIYECSDTVEQSVIPGDSNDNRLTYAK